MTILNDLEQALKWVFCHFCRTTASIWTKSLSEKKFDFFGYSNFFPLELFSYFRLIYGHSMNLHVFPFEKMITLKEALPICPKSCSQIQSLKLSVKRVSVEHQDNTIKTITIIKMNSRMKTTAKVKTNPKMNMTQKWRQLQKW